MKIAILGGLDSHLTIKWANALKNNGDVVTVFSFPEQKGLEGNLSEGISIQFLTKSLAENGQKANAKELRGYIEAGKFDAVNAINALSYGFLAMKAKTKYLLTIAGPDLYAAIDDGQKGIFLKVIKKAAALATPSAAAMQSVKKLFKKDKEIFVVAPGVNIELFDCKPDKYETVTFGSFKAIEPVNDFDTMIEAYKLMKQSVEAKTQIFIYGEGSGKDALAKKINEENLADEIILKGEISASEVAAEMNKMTAVLNTAKRDVFGISTIEAMACGVPCIATDTEGSSEIILNGVTGYTPKIGKPDSIAFRMQEFANYPQNAEKIGSKCRQDIVELYEINACTAAYVKALCAVK